MWRNLRTIYDILRDFRQKQQDLFWHKNSRDKMYMWMIIEKIGFHVLLELDEKAIMLGILCIFMSLTGSESF